MRKRNQRLLRLSCDSKLGVAVLACALLHCGSESPTDTAGALTPAEPDGRGQNADPSAPGSVMNPSEVAPGSNPESVDEDGVTTDPIPLAPSEMPPAPTGMTGPTPPLTRPAPVLPPAALDCGPDGWAVENAGPPSNRVNYVILADGYDATTVDTTLEEHIQRALDRRFNHESGEPYGRYRKFVNICVMKVVSQSNGIGNGPTAFDGGNGGDRLARVNQQKVTAYLDANVPDTLEVDWRAVVLNQDLWENTGSQLMLWSGANRDAPGAALHEGGHGFHQLADEYCASGTGARCGPNQVGAAGNEFQEVNSSGNPQTTGGKWDLWLGKVQRGLKVPDLGATGVQGAFVGSRYTDTGQYRPSSNSMMNSLFGNNVNTSFNSVSREQMIFSIWRAVKPVDRVDPPAGAVSNPASLTVQVIDPAVIDIDWEIDGNVVARAAGGILDLAAAQLSSGSHRVVARAHDNASEDLVLNRSSECPDSVTGRYCHGVGWRNSTETVEWTVTIP